METESYQLFIDGRSYHCSCGCNCFKKLPDCDGMKRYKCNSCGAEYAAAGISAKLKVK